MVVRQRQVHHGPDLDLVLDGHGPVLDGVKTEHGSLRQVDDGGSHERAKDTAVADCEGTTGHILNCELSIASLNDDTRLATTRPRERGQTTAAQQDAF